MKKLFKVVVIFLVIIFSISSISLMAEVFGGASSNKTPSSGNSTIVDVPGNGSSEEETPDEEEEIYYITLPNEGTLINDNITTIKPISKDTNGLFSLSDNYIVYENSSNLEVTGIEFTSILLAENAEPYVDGITMADYSHIKVEFELNNVLSANLLGCDFYLVGRDASNSGFKSNSTELNILATSESGSKVSILTSDGDVVTSDNIKISYVIEINQEAPEASRVQTYINGILFVDSCESGMFKATVAKLTEVRFMEFNSEETSASFGFQNLQVTVYNNNTAEE